MHRTLRGSYSQLDRFLYLPTIPTVLTIRTYNTKSTNTTSSHRGSTAEAVACWGRSQAVRQDGQNRNDQPNTLALCFEQVVQALRANPQVFTSTISPAKSVSLSNVGLSQATAALPSNARFGKMSRHRFFALDWRTNDSQVSYTLEATTSLTVPMLYQVSYTFNPFWVGGYTFNPFWVGDASKLF